MNYTTKELKFIKIVTKQQLDDKVNYTQAAIEAGYDERYAGQTGSSLMKKPKIKREVNKGLNKILRQYNINTYMVVKSLADIASANVADLFHPDGSMKSMAEICNTSASAIGKVEITQTRDRDGNDVFNKKITLLDSKDRLKALELLGRHLGTFNPETADLIDETDNDTKAATKRDQLLIELKESPRFYRVETDTNESTASGGIKDD